MIQTIRIAIIIILLSIAAFPQQSQQKIDDKEKTSSRINDMFSDPQTLKKIQNLGGAIKGGVKLVQDKGKEIKEAGSLKEYLKNQDIKENAEKTTTVYKNLKMGFWNVLHDIAGKVVTVMDKAQERINQWQTTLPTIQGYYNVMRRWTDATADVLRDFQISDMVDIERKWDRRLEDQAQQFRYTVTSFGMWMQERYTAVNAKANSDRAKEYYQNMLMKSRLDRMAKSSDPKMVQAYIEVVGGLDAFTLVPKTALAQMGETFFLTNEIGQKYHGIEEKKGTSMEMAMYDTVKNLLDKEERTIDDERQLSVYINKKRQMLAADLVAIEQMKANTMVVYSRLKLWDREIEVIHKQRYAQGLAEIAGAGISKIN
jgi:hypothetical protein